MMPVSSNGRRRDAIPSSSAKALRPAICPDLYGRFRKARQSVKPFTPEKCHDLRHRAGCAAQRRRTFARAESAIICWGMGVSPSTHARHRQCALPDRAIADLRPGRPPGHRAASAAWTEQRARRVRRGPDRCSSPDYKSVEDVAIRVEMRLPGASRSTRSAARRRRDHGRGAQ